MVDIPAWISAIATVLGLAAATGAAVIARRVYAIESARDERAEEDRIARRLDARRVQANKVAGWYGWDEDSEEWGGFLRNSSDIPVYELNLRFFALLLNADESAWDFAFCGEAPLIRVLPPGETLFVPRHENIDVSFVNELLQSKQLDASKFNDYSVDIFFNDAAGVRWWRQGGGALIEEKTTRP